MLRFQVDRLLRDGPALLFSHVFLGLLVARAGLEDHVVPAFQEYRRFHLDPVFRVSQVSRGARRVRAARRHRPGPERRPGLARREDRRVHPDQVSLMNPIHPLGQVVPACLAARAGQCCLVRPGNRGHHARPCHPLGLGCLDVPEYPFPLGGSTAAMTRRTLAAPPTVSWSRK